jgi:hypothetical protein
VMPPAADFVADSPVARITRTLQTRMPVLASSGRMVGNSETIQKRGYEKRALPGEWSPIQKVNRPSPSAP